MSPTVLLLIRCLLIGSFAAYFAHEWRERRRVRDEREELIRLKTFELVQKTTTVALSLLALAYLLWPAMNA